MSQTVIIDKSGKSKNSFNTIARRRQFIGILFALPAILGFLVFTIGPMIASFVFSFMDYKIISTPIWLGFDNYLKLLSGKDPWFFASVKATAYYVALSVPANLIFAFLIALLLNNEMKLRALFRSIFYVPSIVPAVASSFVWMLMMNPNFGIFNMVLKSLGLPTSKWIFSEATVIPSIVFMGLFSTGSTMVIFLAGLQNIPRHYYEAIDVDGGNRLHKFIYITLPMISPTIFFNFIMGIIGAFQVFGSAYIMTQGGPNNASLFYVYNLWRTAFTHMEMGLASAQAWLLFIVIMFFSFIVFKTSKLWVFYEGGQQE
ncbi:MAG: carbohydrate ABC transporter permease [Christensenellales bacterium]|jgi:multiple sugar transport system permease protein